MEILNKMEGFFDFKDFIVRILKRWRLIVGVAVIFTIALGGIKYVTGISNIGTETSEENDNHSTQSEIKNIKKHRHETGVFTMRKAGLEPAQPR